MPEPSMRKVLAAYVPQVLTLLVIAAVIVTLAVAIVSSAPDHPVPAVTPCREPGSGGSGNPFMGSDVEHDPADCDPTADPAEVYAPPPGAPNEGDAAARDAGEEGYAGP